MCESELSVVIPHQFFLCVSEGEGSWPAGMEVVAVSQQKLAVSWLLCDLEGEVGGLEQGGESTQKLGTDWLYAAQVQPELPCTGHGVFLCHSPVEGMSYGIHMLHTLHCHQEGEVVWPQL